MEVKIVKNENGQIALELKLEKDEWREYLSKVSLQMQKRKAIPGYRVGKAPLGIAYKTYGQPLVQAAGEEAINEKLTQICIENDWAPVSQPFVTVVTADLQGFEAMVSFVDYPRVEDLQYKGVKVERPYKTVTEADVDELVDKYMRNHLYVHEVPREARMGDIVEVSFTGTHNGGPFEYDHNDKSRWVVGSGQLFTGLDEAICGHVAGDHLELSLTMPEDFHREAVRGLTLDLKVDLIGVWARDLLEMTDEYVKENVRDCETVAEFREKRRAAHQANYDSISKRLVNYNLDTAIADLVTCPIPEEMIQVSMARHMQTLQSMTGGRSIEEYLAAEGSTVEKFQADVRPNCERQVKISIALDYVARAENLEVSQIAFDNFVNAQAIQMQTSAENALVRLGGAENVAEKLLNEQAMRIIRDNMVVVDVEVEEFPKVPGIT